MKTIKIFGAPGCGKTTKMLELLETELKAGTKLNRICFVTATVAARDEARQRAQRLLPHARDEDFKFFRTIHGICFGELHLGRSNVMQTEDYLALGDKISVPFSDQYSVDLDDDGLPHGFAHSMGNEILALRQLAAAWMVPIFHQSVLDSCPDNIAVEEIKYVTETYANFKRIGAKFDFVDMLQMYLGDTYAPLPIDVIFIDEAQDLSKLQWAVVDKFAGMAQRRYVAGDDDQSIYGFIGADPLGFYKLKADETIILPRTYRLRRRIWEFAHKIITGVKDRVEKNIEVNGEGGQLEYFGLDWSYLNYEDDEIMLIARHHSQLSGIAKALEKRGIPFRHRGQSLTGTDRAKAVYYFLKAREHAITNRDASYIIRLVNRNHYKNFAEVARTRPDGLIDGAGLAQYGVDLAKPWASQFGQSRRDHFQNEGIAAILRENHPAALVEDAKVTLTTFHASKGRESNHVVLFTNCYQSAWEHAQTHPDDERRLAYVGVTRAKEKLTIVSPTSDMYMQSLL